MVFVFVCKEKNEILMNTFYYNNIPFAYSIFGNGNTTLVFVHGFGEDSWVFTEQVNFLKEKYKVVVIDLPGCGNALLPNSADSDMFKFLESLHFLGDGVVALLLYLQLQNIVLLGHSMGGYIVLNIEKNHPQLSLAFGLIHSTAFADSAEKKETRKKGIDAMEQYGGFAFLKNTIPNLFSLQTKQHNYSLIENTIANAKLLQTKALQAFYTAMMNRDDSTQVLINTPKKVLFIAGVEDVAAPLNDVVQQAGLPTISYIHVLENVGHMGMLENKEVVNQHIFHFANYLE